ncbi:ComF family protein [Chitinivorax sp. B]|uniref:ComF family protein n=1 Tax=Chitinivorax sp. B TaxID=2502235 RepID=UPI00201736E3|nr:ComF family protein [Chitinivorax sp. B]
MPHQCTLCGATTNEPFLCQGCYTDLPWLPNARCPICAIPTLDNQPCGRCLRDPPAFDATYCQLAYAYPLDALIRDYKFNNRLNLQPLLSSLLQSIATHNTPDLLIPAPLSSRRLRERGFNQAQELARPLSKRGWQLSTQHIIKIRETAVQNTLKWQQRASNVKGAFECIDTVQGKHILLVDDVMTTGATLNELATTLKRWGAVEVNCLVLARTLSERS